MAPTGTHDAFPFPFPEAPLLRVLDLEGRVLEGAPDPGLSTEAKVAIHEAMVRARLVDEALERMQRQGRIGFHIGALGEEAAVIGSVAALAPEDWIFPCYREWAGLLYRGFPLERFVDGMLGNAGDPVKGRQMPAHVTGKAYRYASVSSPIGTQVPHAVGFAHALSLRRAKEVVAVYFGDGATSSNDFHAGMNFAGVWKAPVLLLCRNNGFAISLRTEEQTATKTIAEKAAAYGIHAIRCDGNDPLAVVVAVREARERALRGDGATLVDMLTYRLGGHSTSDDPRVYRSDRELESHRTEDPIPRFRKHLELLGAMDEANDRALRARVEAEIKENVARAEAVPKPELSTLFEDVFEKPTAILGAQAAECLRGPRPEGGR